MTVAYNFKKAIDLPAWQWLAPFPVGPAYNGTSQSYDGTRYMYWVLQTGTSAVAVSTTALYRYDTWSNGWQYLAAVTNSNQGVDVEYDAVRNVVYVINGTTTGWQVFNLNTTSVTIANVACPAWTLTTMTPVLPALAGVGSSFTMPNDVVVPTTIDSGTADVTGNTTTAIQATALTGTFGQGMINLQLRVLTGAQTGQLRTITGVTAPNIISVSPAFAAPLTSGDTFQIELVNDAATGGSTTTVIDTTANWTVNAYANMDVMIITGTGAGQRRRIASNTATTLTLAGAVTGNARTGPFATAPVSGSTYRIVPSSDFLYYQVGGALTFYRIDLAQTTGAAWTAMTSAPAILAGGANTFYPAQYAPYQIIGFRGGATATYYMYNIGTNAWTTPTVFAGVETFTTGAGAAMVSGKRKMIIQKEGTTRLYILDLLTGIYEPAGTVPYAAPGAYDGKRLRVLTTVDGAQFLYVLRAGGQEFFRVPLEWV